jgi:tetratricopeptide (TPR) repeat protein
LVTWLRGQARAHAAPALSIYRMALELNGCLHALYLFYEQQRFYLQAIDLYEEALHHFSAEHTQQTNQSEAEITLLIGRLQSYFGLWHARLGRFAQAQALYESSWLILQEADAAAICLGFWGAFLKGSNPRRAAALLTEAVHLLSNTDERWMKALGY